MSTDVNLTPPPRHPLVPVAADRKAESSPTTTHNAIAPEATVIIPTRNESGNVTALFHRLDAALGPMNVEVLFVDDSDDDTPARIREASANSKRTVRVLHRPADDRDGGLGGAVLAGFLAANAPWALVMDGDLQHPPEAVPALLTETVSQDIDLVVASRYAGDGNAGGLDGRWRASASSLCTHLAKLVFARKLDGVTDPMSGFFAVRLSAVDLARLRPKGYKILIELIGRSQLRATAEVTYSFQPRLSGTSKASVRQGAIFVRQLVWLRLVGGRRPRFEQENHPDRESFGAALG